MMVINIFVFCTRVYLENGLDVFVTIVEVTGIVNYELIVGATKKK